ncbi:Oidioi.mRNA.OKI2018_I69.chr1.g3040.t2.cds [Oikopleura dioica]|uniref:Oidioi.mRNA.OKI2018_I69.chr1.g3040.t2.cds n=1 Tax=Oikopleura dioica TaxID=34765 RepID=A0ABN7SY97_OIKDI|nr:Oidioi.mRNA.OKI2018_I69.chr1.g3040.t2.cds [Oikopleura dioica]
MKGDPDAPHVVNLINSVVGVGILAIPFCFKQCGLLLGALVLAFAGYATYSSVALLLHAAVSKSKHNYEYLCKACFGGTGKFGVEFAQIGLMLGTCIAFYVVISGLLTEVYVGFFETEENPVDENSIQKRLVLCLGVFVVYPLGVLRELSAIAKFAYFSSCFYVFFLLVLTFNSVAGGFASFDWIQEVKCGVFKVLPIFALSFTCQSQFFVIYASISDATSFQMLRIMRKTICIVGFVYIYVGFFGYSLFQEEVKGNMLLNFPRDIVLQFTKLGFAMSVIVGFPLMIYPCRQSIFTCFVEPTLNKPSYESLAGESTESPVTFIPDNIFRSLTAVIVFLTMTVAYFIQDVEVVLQLNGALMGSFIAFILPALCFEKACASTFMKEIRWKYTQRLIFLTGVLALTLGVYQNLPAMESFTPSYLAMEDIDIEYENMKEKLNDGIEVRDTKYPMPADPEISLD